eukprot:Hpha_TRINITY_DN12939_c0_g1::TRINITY_DN12939_c0_g1_i1::g.164659::m.164659
MECGGEGGRGAAVRPTRAPSRRPSLPPTRGPTGSPTISPLTSVPSRTPTGQPTTPPSSSPRTPGPTSHPSLPPSRSPSPFPSAPPTEVPSNMPSINPSYSPTSGPTLRPSPAPTVPPTIYPSRAPILSPSASPTRNPSRRPSPPPTATPTLPPSRDPSRSPSHSPSPPPTGLPAPSPSIPPSWGPTKPPTRGPSLRPSASPSTVPTLPPSREPSWWPSVPPTRGPSTGTPTQPPSPAPTGAPSLSPSRRALYTCTAGPPSDRCLCPTVGSQPEPRCVGAAAASPLPGAVVLWVDVCRRGACTSARRCGGEGLIDSCSCHGARVGALCPSGKCAPNGACRSSPKCPQSPGVVCTCRHAPVGARCAALAECGGDGLCSRIADAEAVRGRRFQPRRFFSEADLDLSHRLSPREAVVGLTRLGSPLAAQKPLQGSRSEAGAVSLSGFAAQGLWRRSLFGFFNTDAAGELTPAEVRAGVERLLGRNVSGAEQAALMAAADPDSSHTVSISEWLASGPFWALLFDHFRTDPLPNSLLLAGVVRLSRGALAPLAGAELAAQVDADGNGTVSRAEFVHGGELWLGYFTALDADASGGVSSEELRAGVEALRGGAPSAASMRMIVDAADADGTGGLSRLEFAARWEGWHTRVFRAAAGGRDRLTPAQLEHLLRKGGLRGERWSQADLDGSGAVSPEEFFSDADTWRVSVYRTLQGNRSGTEVGLDTLSGIITRLRVADPEKTVNVTDTDRSGGISLAEWVCPGPLWSALFEAADVDRSWTLSLTEFEGFVRSLPGTRLSRTSITRAFERLAAPGGNITPPSMQPRGGLWRLLFDEAAGGNATLTEPVFMGLLAHVGAEEWGEADADKSGSVDMNEWLPGGGMPGVLFREGDVDASNTLSVHELRRLLAFCDADNEAEGILDSVFGGVTSIGREEWLASRVVQEWFFDCFTFDEELTVDNLTSTLAGIRGVPIEAGALHLIFSLYDFDFSGDLAVSEFLSYVTTQPTMPTTAPSTPPPKGSLRQTIRIEVLRGRDFAERDAVASDPFVVVTALPGTIIGITPTLPRTRHPDWTFGSGNVFVAEVSETDRLEFKVEDRDPLGTDFLGHRVLRASDLPSGKAVRLVLHPRKDYPIDQWIYESQGYGTLEVRISVIAEHLRTGVAPNGGGESNSDLAISFSHPPGQVGPAASRGVWTRGLAAVAELYPDRVPLVWTVSNWGLWRIRLDADSLHATATGALVVFSHFDWEGKGELRSQKSVSGVLWVHSNGSAIHRDSTVVRVTVGGVVTDGTYPVSSTGETEVVLRHGPQPHVTHPHTTATLRDRGEGHGRVAQEDVTGPCTTELFGIGGILELRVCVPAWGNSAAAAVTAALTVLLIVTPIGSAVDFRRITDAATGGVAVPPGVPNEDSP